MGTSRTAIRLGSSICLLALAACGGGGGGGGASTTPVTTTPVTTTPVTTTPATTTTTTTPTVPTVSIAAPTSLSTSGFGSSGTNFTTNPPAIGFSFRLPGVVGHITPTKVDTATSGQDASITYRGTVTSNGVPYPLFDLSIPSLSVNATNVRGDGTPVTISNGQVVAGAATMTYTLTGAWAFTPSAGGESYLGQAVSGYTTPQSGLPATGSATYSGNGSQAGGGGVAGAYFVPSGTGTIQAGTVSGNVTINADFAGNKLAGTFTNMTATPAGSSTSTPWNDVSVAASFNRTTTPPSTDFSGTTAVKTVPTGAGTAGFSNAAVGAVIGSFYGPTAQEVGGVWTLAEPNTTNGKAAFGTFGAK